MAEPNTLSQDGPSSWLLCQAGGMPVVSWKKQFSTVLLRLSETVQLEPEAGPGKFQPEHSKRGRGRIVRGKVGQADRRGFNCSPQAE